MTDPRAYPPEKLETHVPPCLPGGGKFLCGGGGHSDSGLDELPGGYTMSAMRGESCRLTTAVEHFGHEAQQSWMSSFFSFSLGH